jgi:hypothetical protein
MSPHKEKYVLTVKCKMCPFQVTQEVKIEPDDLIKAKTEMVEQAASIHKKHASIENFEVY